jgi:hypothetical protein
VAPIGGPDPALGLRLAQKRRQGGQPQHRAVGGAHRQDALQEVTPAAAVADRAEVVHAGVGGVVDLGGVLHQQRHPRTARRRPGLVPVRRGQGGDVDRRLVQEAVARLEHRRLGQRGRQGGVGVGGKPFGDGDEAPGAARVAEVAGGEGRLRPAGRVEDGRQRGGQGRRVHPPSLPTPLQPRCG